MTALTSFLLTLNTSPETVEFKEAIDVITHNYHYTPVSFKNGNIKNEAGTNEGSCKLFAFGQLNGLSEAQMLACFGVYYRDDVLGNPEGADHANIRNFMQTGWAGILFDQPALVQK